MPPLAALASIACLASRGARASAKLEVRRGGPRFEECGRKELRRFGGAEPCPGAESGRRRYPPSRRPGTHPLVGAGPVGGRQSSAIGDKAVQEKTTADRTVRKARRNDRTVLISPNHSASAARGILTSQSIAIWRGFGFFRVGMRDPLAGGDAAQRERLRRDRREKLHIHHAPEEVHLGLHDSLHPAHEGVEVPGASLGHPLLARRPVGDLGGNSAPQTVQAGEEICRKADR